MKSDLENSYALLIDISKHKDEQIPQLRFAADDTESIQQLFLDKQKVGLKYENVKTLVNEETSAFKIKDAISNWLYRNADPNSTVLFYFAGHRGVEEDRAGRSKDGFSKFILPWDANFDNLYASAISNTDFNDLLLTIETMERYPKSAQLKLSFSHHLCRATRHMMLSQLLQLTCCTIPNKLMV
jgi:hypothetical protein